MRVAGIEDIESSGAADVTSQHHVSYGAEHELLLQFYIITLRRKPIIYQVK